MVYNGGTTSNLKQHLDRLHKSNIQAEEDEEKSQPIAKQLSITKFSANGKLRNARALTVPWTVDMQKEVTRLLAKWTWKDMRPISIVRDDGLKELLSFLVPSYQLPSTTHVSSLIRKDYLDGKAAITAKLHGNTIALTTDIWTSRATQSFATTTAHFINKNWNLTSCVLETKHFPGHHTGVSISEKLQETLTSYKVNMESVSAIVHDEASNAVLAGKILWDVAEWESIVCAAHRLQNAIKHAVDNQSMQRLLAKCRHLVGHFKHSALATDGLMKKQKALGFTKILRVIQETPTRWNSSFYMLQRLVFLKQPIRLYLEDTMDEVDRRSYDLTDNQWAVAKALLNLLESVDQVTTTLSGEKYSTLSWCLPLMYGLRKVAEPDHNDSSTVRSVKANLIEQLDRRFNLRHLKVDSPVVLAAALDPRFRKLNFLSTEERLQLKSVLIDKAVDCDAAVVPADTSGPPAKKQKSVLDRLLGDDEEAVSGVTVSDEVDAYFEERPSSRKEDPFVWWRSNSSRFPRLSYLAKKFLSMPATSTLSERVFSVAGIVVDRKRCALTPDMVNALVFLHKNSYMLGLTEEEPSVPQAELLLLPKDHETIEISDNEVDTDDTDDVIEVESGDEETGDESNTSDP